MAEEDGDLRQRLEAAQREIESLKAALQEKERKLSEVSGLLSPTFPSTDELNGLDASVETPLNIIIPLVGLGSAFSDAGYRCPKPMINIIGRPVLFWQIDLLPLGSKDTLWVAVSENLNRQFGIGARLRERYPRLDLRIVLVTFETHGWAETLLSVVQEIEEEDRRKRTLCIDCHTLFLDFDVLSSVRRMATGVAAATFCFKYKKDHPRYSYVKLGEGQRLTEVREKVRISQLANCGAYMFRSATELLAVVRQKMEEPVKKSPRARTSPGRASAGTRQIDFHPSGVLRNFMEGEDDVVGVEVAVEDFVTIGTPEELRWFISRVAGGEVTLTHSPTRFCFALEHVLVRRGDAGEEVPDDKNIKLVQKLKSAGHIIILTTTVGQSEGQRIFEMLSHYEIPYDELHFGKPRADVYVDTLAISAGTEIEKDIGWSLQDQQVIPGGVAPRHFNEVSVISPTQVVKSSASSDILKGEMYYYNNLPTGLEHLFPQAISVHDDGDACSIVLERIPGVTFTQLMINNCLTPGRLLLLLEALHALHTASPGTKEDLMDGALLCANYAKKVRKRYESHKALYDSFADVSCNKMVDALLGFLEDFEKGARQQHAYFIHGDPVFSNVLFTGARSVKLIDMRGEVAGRLTTQGDAHYDLSKVYQSLCGYDYIITGRELTQSAAALLDELRSTFWAFVGDKYPKVRNRDVRLLTAQHYFSIIPLHNDKSFQSRFLRNAQSMLTLEGLY